VKRLILILSLVVGLLAAAPAQATNSTYHGSNADGGALAFVAQQRNGQNRTVHPFLTGSVALHCAQGDIHSSYNTDQAMRVSKKERFSGTLTPLDEPSQGTTTIQVTGRFTHNENKAVGTLRAHLTGASFGDCDSGIVDWSTKLGDVQAR
jgi:hypothetical protein